MAKLEIKNLNSELPNSPEAIEERDSKVDLMNVFIDGFSKIASDIENINKNANTSEAVESVVVFSNALSKWWSEKNQIIIDIATGMPILAGATVVLKYCDIDLMVQNLVVATTAAAWYGKNTVETAVKAAKRIAL
ncbi:hypothetical protein [Methylobacterium frigidaeris]|uniref:hypothetical protein n=1 Tax=Methylobacterium frigidaeris TaxID=2038277 RepID=UPI001056B669|nr:hypothetical protein [Methylobacterium frigidaeris]